MPACLYDGTDLYIFFTTETKNPKLSVAEITTIKIDWDLANDHNLYILEFGSQSTRPAQTIPSAGII